MTTRKPRTEEELWMTLEKDALDAELEAIAAMSDEEVAREIEAAGGDPKAIGERGAKLAKELDERWQRQLANAELLEEMERVKKLAASLARKPTGLPREALVERVKSAARDPRLSQPAAVMFRKRVEEESSVEELEAMLVELELLAQIEDAKKKG